MSNIFLLLIVCYLECFLTLIEGTYDQLVWGSLGDWSCYCTQAIRERTPHVRRLEERGFTNACAEAGVEIF